MTKKQSITDNGDYKEHNISAGYQIIYNHLSDENRCKYDDIVNKNYISIKSGKISNYVDPDKRIIENLKIGAEDIRLAPDGICGLKYLEKYLDKEKDKADAYRLIRSKIIMWPKHEQSINVRRYAFFRDRIDFTLFDIKQYYENKGSKLIKGNTKTITYLNELKPFENFVEKYELMSFIYNDGNVKNLAKGGVIDGYGDYDFSADENKKYLNGLISILEKDSNRGINE